MEQLNQLKKDNCNDGLDEKFAGLKFWAIIRPFVLPTKSWNLAILFEQSW